MCQFIDNSNIFIHIPKCGGTYIINNLNSKTKSYLKKDIYNINNKLIGRHFGIYSLIKNNIDITNITSHMIFRDPVEWYVSLYYYVKDYIDHPWEIYARDSFKHFFNNIIDMTVTSISNTKLHLHLGKHIDIFNGRKPLFVKYKHFNYIYEDIKNNKYLDNHQDLNILLSQRNIKEGAYTYWVLSLICKINPVLLFSYNKEHILDNLDKYLIDNLKIYNFDEKNTFLEKFGIIPNNKILNSTNHKRSKKYIEHYDVEMLQKIKENHTLFYKIIKKFQINYSYTTIINNTNAIWGKVDQPKTSNDKITYLGDYHTFEEIDTTKFSDEVLVWHTPKFSKEEWKYGLYGINTKPTWDYIKEENITTIELNHNKIDAIFIQSYYKELQHNRLYHFLLHLKDTQNIKIPIYIFVDNESKKYIDIIKEFNINIVYVDDTKYANKISSIFYKLINYKIDTYKRILLLETDCKLKYDFINTINNDLINYDNYWIYGSYYYGNYKNPAFKNKNHINGVAIYNREPKFIILIKDFFIKNNNINIKDNYDYILSNKIIEIGKKDKLIDSKYILNLSCPCDEKLNGDNIKNKNVICHQKY